MREAIEIADLDSLLHDDLHPALAVLGYYDGVYLVISELPVGTRLSSNMGLTQVRVLESGTARRGQWVDERVNVRDDWLAYFEEKDVPKPAGIAVLTDSDDTHSSAQGDYAKFRVCTE